MTPFEIQELQAAAQRAIDEVTRSAAMPANVLHSKKTPKWGTPGDVATLSRCALGGTIDLDPASSPEFNQTIGARRIITEQENGLTSSWLTRPEPVSVLGVDLAPFEPPLELTSVTVFCNPPGGLVKQFWAKLLAELVLGHVSAAIWIGFSVEQLCILQDSELYPLDFSSVILRKRLAFIREDGESGGSPSHGNYITGINIPADNFSALFGHLGRVVHGQAAI